MHLPRASFSRTRSFLLSSKASTRCSWKNLLTLQDETDPAKIEELINLAIQAAEFIKKNVVQGIEVPREDHRGVFCTMSRYFLKCEEARFP